MILTESDRLRSWILLNRLHEQMQQNVSIAIPNIGPDPEPIGKLYFKRSEIYDRIVNKMHEMAPDGVSSQHQFVEILEQAINTVNDELKRTLSPDDMSNLVLTINDVERELMFTPYQTLQENKGEMGKQYAWKEGLMQLVQDYVRKQAKPDMNMDQILDSVKQSVKNEIDSTLDMIYNILRMVPVAAFYNG